MHNYNFNGEFGTYDTYILEIKLDRKCFCNTALFEHL